MIKKTGGQRKNLSACFILYRVAFAPHIETTEVVLLQLCDKPQHRDGGVCI